jgi:hypothetical protein
MVAPAACASSLPLAIRSAESLISFLISRAASA